MRTILAIHLTLVLLLLGCRQDRDASVREISENDEVESSLAFTVLPLDDLSNFRAVGANWSVVQSVSCDYQKEHNIQGIPGTGVLLNKPGPDAMDNIATQFEHGDLEIQFEVMLPKGSNSGVYFQGRYEIQLFDSWKKENPTFTDLGGIYQRWDESRPEGSKGFEGVAPRINASKTPGLWEHFHVLFRAPRFDENGQKIENAKFEFVRLNGMLIQQDIEVSGPTRAHQLEGEAALGPLFIQGDHGPVAFRNIKYKSYHHDTLILSDLNYQVFEGKYDFIPNFDTLIATASGVVNDIDLTSITSLSEGFCAILEGSITVQQAGDYLFETRIDDGGDLYIDSILVVHNEGEPGMGTERGKIFLTEGTHGLKITYYQEVWNATLELNYEGPGIYKRSLGSTTAFRRDHSDSQPLLLPPSPDPTLLRGFVMYGDEKLTHTISIAEPAGTHYSYDLATASLVKAWKGPFGDLSNMWRGRGHSQTHEPTVASILLTKNSRLARLSDIEESPWPVDEGNWVYKGYAIDGQQRPIFLYDFGAMEMKDQIIPDGDQLRRTISLVGGDLNNLYFRIARTRQVQKLPNGLFSIDGEYYITAPKDALVRSQGDEQELLYPISDSKFSYSILW
ncbi:MAG: DUF1080 domain-containing protein [Saprospiraceae bacterium]|nr:DUF1080 domain-containing protein [Saprospiraceae bacterium]